MMKQEESWEVRAQSRGRGEDKQRKLLKWCLAFAFLRWVPRPLEISDGKGQIGGETARAGIPESWWPQTSELHL